MILGIISKKKYDKIINVGIITVLDWLCGFIFVAFRLSLNLTDFLCFMNIKEYVNTAMITKAQDTLG